ncbi:adenine phosphoribosyltransferase [Sphingobacterium sp. SGG-5]|uniref:adenine phosphoribosyltransferase n=1 Tax=Sphingobacterium sp. SGG-5 TaxID=2710881 RepID=UPI0013EDBF41|nr:adenine phosphoribosyltransferase [Sphingobacterium sp. SGG-5]NGM61451.1 adenine phosphoribosyltransferase [Sphingobacterium sp. SGG-5]
MLIDKLRSTIRDIPDFPQPGIVFKDITPILKDPELCNAIVEEFASQLDGIAIDVVAGIESRGFLFGLMLASRLGLPFVPIRKQGKLPYQTIAEGYKLEYGQAIIEVHADAFEKGDKVLIHDDLLATGGTVVAASKLVERTGAQVAGFSFLISLDFLHAKSRLRRFSEDIITLINY